MCITVIAINKEINKQQASCYRRFWKDFKNIHTSALWLVLFRADSALSLTHAHALHTHLWLATGMSQEGVRANQRTVPLVSAEKKNLFSEGIHLNDKLTNMHLNDKNGPNHYNDVKHRIYDRMKTANYVESTRPTFYFSFHNNNTIKAALFKSL